MPNVQHKRGTRAALVALAGANGLLPGQVYVLTDENRIAVALTVSTFETFAKQSEAGGGGGAPGGTSGQVQFNNAGAFDGADGVGIDGTGNLILSSQPAQPAAPPADTLQLYARRRANVDMLEVQRPNGREMPLAIHPGFNFYGYWLPQDSGTLVVSGIPRAVVGTVSHPNIVSGGRVLAARRWRTLSGTTANSVSENFASRAHAMRGAVAGEGGFEFLMRFAAVTTTASAKGAFGLFGTLSALATTFVPSTYANTAHVALAFDLSVGPNWHIQHNDGAGTPTIIPLGAAFPVTINALLTLVLTCAVNGTVIGCRVVNEETGAIFDQNLTADIPAGNQLLSAKAYMNNGGVAAAVAYDILRVTQFSDN